MTKQLLKRYQKFGQINRDCSALVCAFVQWIL